MLDIIIFAVIAVVLFIKLFSMLGQKRDMDREDFEASRAQSRASPRNPHMKEVELKLETITDPMTKLKVLDPVFDKKKFLKEAKDSYKKILTLYAEGNTHDLSDMINIEMMRKFAYAITQREEKELKCKASILKIKDAVIENVSFEKDTLATLRVAFDSEVIHYTLDKKNHVQVGHKTKIDNRKDVWTFCKDLKRASSRWKLASVSDLF